MIYNYFLCNLGLYFTLFEILVGPFLETIFRVMPILPLEFFHLGDGRCGSCHTVGTKTTANLLEYYLQ